MRGLLRAGAVVVAIFVLVILGIRPTYATPPLQAATTHVVKPGETLISIALHYGTSVAALKQANGLRNSNFIWTGQRLKIPSEASAEEPAPAAPATPAPAPAASSTNSTTVHRVRAGETLFGISAKYGVSTRAIMNANGLRSANFIYTGQRLVIPTGQSSSPPSKDTPQPSAEQIPPEAIGKRIEVSLSKQTVFVFDHGALVYSALASTGVARYPTPVGAYRIKSKFRAQTMVGPGYYLPNVPYVMYFRGGFALHGTYWHKNFGRPMSHGCVNLSQKDAAWIYTWAPVGTEVVVYQ